MSALWLAWALILTSGPGGRSNVPAGLLWAPSVAPVCRFGVSRAQDDLGYIVSVDLVPNAECGGAR